jgi:hypothetical protein
LGQRDLATMLDDLTAWDPAVLDQLATTEDDMDEPLASFREQTTWTPTLYTTNPLI